MSARLIVFEGGEGCGKSTQARLLADALGAVSTREPGGTPIGERIRALLLDPATARVAVRTEALLMAADRAQHVEEVIAPALESGRHVVTDRFAGSSIAYQGYGRGLPVNEVRDLSRWATGGIRPDLVIVLDVSRDVAAVRLDRALDRFELEDGGFHERVRAGFLAQAAAEPERWAVLDGDAPVEVVTERVRTLVRERLQLPV